jgi:hypothetical protein
MRILIILILLLSAHFSLTAFMPADPGKAWLLWPFAGDSKPVFAFVGGLPIQPGSVAVPVLAGIAALCLIGALFSLIGLVVPEGWWAGLVIAGTVASAALYIAYFSSLSIVPIALDVLLLWGIFAQHWSVAALRGV